MGMGPDALFCDIEHVDGAFRATGGPGSGPSAAAVGRLGLFWGGLGPITGSVGPEAGVGPRLGLQGPRLSLTKRAKCPGMDYEML